MPAVRKSVVLGAMIALGMAIAPPFTSQPNVQAQTSPTPAPRADIPLIERPTYVGTCRSSGTTPLTVYASSSLNQAISTVQPYTRVVLTGVLGSGTAQIANPVTGWVRSATLLSDCNAVPDPGVTRGICYQAIPSELAVRTAPYGSLVALLSQNQRVYTTTPPNRQTTVDGRVWLQVYYDQTNNLGWIAQTGTGGLGVNLLPCP